jgi:hypothetical protein
MYYWSNKTPAAPTGAANVVFKGDGGSPEKRSAHITAMDENKPGVLALPTGKPASKYLGADGNFQGNIASAVFNLTDAATIAVDATKGNLFRVTLGGDRMLGNPTGAKDGQLLRFEFKQDGTGGRKITFDTKIKRPANVPNVALTAYPAAIDVVQMLYNSTEDIFYLTGLLLNVKAQTS